MSQSLIPGFRFAGAATCVPPRVVDNMEYGKDFGADEVRKVVAMAGVQYRHVVEPGVTTSDLCYEAATRLLDRLGWERDSVTGLILVTQTPDYFLPSSSCVIHKWLGLADHCATFDVGLGCSGYPYGLYLAATMLRAGGHRRILVLVGETPTRFQSPDEHATTLLFADAGSATALEYDESAPGGAFCMLTDGSGYDGLIVPGGGFRNLLPENPRDRFLYMDGPGIFNFTIKRVPPLIRDTLALAGKQIGDVDRYLFHQSNRFIMKHLMKKCGLPEDRVPIVIDRFGNTGGASVTLALTHSWPDGARAPAHVMAIGYGVGLSWGSALLQVAADVPLLHDVYTGDLPRA